ncbi:DnaJ domain [Phaffia rhodozyma]|uniref:DnaJ domain n=1 Tax=Phaffia rhodozyma TaxID=264483 RepID=A0A0F7SIU9_PHARH|nr:DnaJ domain [Phaffia rhodozyma]
MLTIRSRFLYSLHTFPRSIASPSKDEDPYGRIYDPLEVTEEQTVKAIDLIRQASGPDVDLKFAYLPFWSIAYIYYGKPLFYTQSGGGLLAWDKGDHPFLLTVEVSGTDQADLATLQFPISPHVYVPSIASSSSSSVNLTAQLPIPQFTTPSSPLQGDHAAAIVPFTLGPPTGRLSKLVHEPFSSGKEKTFRLSSSTNILNSASNMRGSTDERTKRKGKGKGKERERRNEQTVGRVMDWDPVFPQGGSISRILHDSVHVWDRVAFPIRKPVIVASKTTTEGRQLPTAAVDINTLQIKRATLRTQRNSTGEDAGRIIWDDAATSFHQFKKISGLKTDQFTDAQLSANVRDRLDWSSPFIHSFQPYHSRSLHEPGPSNLSGVRIELTAKLSRIKIGSAVGIVNGNGSGEVRGIDDPDRILSPEAWTREVLIRPQRIREKQDEKQRLKEEAELNQARRQREAQMNGSRPTTPYLRTNHQTKQSPNTQFKNWGSSASTDSHTPNVEMKGIPAVKIRSDSFKLNDSDRFYFHLGISLTGRDAIPTDVEIEVAHKQQIERHHPDRGGLASMAASINQARDNLKTAELSLIGLEYFGWFVPKWCMRTKQRNKEEFTRLDGYDRYK